jgi:hypothetical protein
LIEAELKFRHDNDVGSIEKGDLANPEVDDLLDDLGEMVTKWAAK